ncbi:MAG TPA: response regulator [Candidatus Competibacter sp.]|nr:response regulator [Candidatus Competibacter sp.]
MEKKLLVIDDSAAFREAISAAGEDHGWMVLNSDNLEEIEKWLAKHSPDVVLLDWELPGQQRQQYANLLTANKLVGKTLLLSATINDVREQFITQHRLAGYRLKPLDLGRFEEEIGLSEQCAIPYKPEFEGLFNSIEVAINILDGNLDEFLSNTWSKKEPLTVPQRLIVKWLRAEMEGKGHKAARRLDWDGEKECFLESRLFKLNNGNYWLARDWRVEGEQPHDHEILNLENVHTLKDWLGSVAMLLAQRYAISRFRVYKLAPLPHIEIYGLQNTRLVIPYFQSGGGFEPNEEVWHRTGFLANKNIYTEKALRIDYKPQPEIVNDANPNTGCESIRYGEKNTYRVLFPVRGQDGGVSALFALDRRFDHAGTLAGFDQEVVETAKRMASDDAGALSREQWSLMKGLIQDIGERLAARLTIDEKDRIRDWHKTISKVLKSTLAELGRSPEMIYEGLSRVCTALADKLNEKTISGRVMGTTPWSQANENNPISAWYIALMTDETHWQAIAGCGVAYEMCRQYGGHELKEPHKTAKLMEAWKAVVIQDFQNWIRAIPNHSYYGVGDDQFSPSAWLGVPIQVDGSVRALMVVHSPHAYYFTAFRVSLMENTAERLLSLLAAAQRETRARSAFAASVMHEVKNDSHSALMILRQIQQEATHTEWAIRLAEAYHYLEGLNALGQDTLNIFQLGRGEGIQEQRESDEDISTTLDNLIKSAIVGWRTLYEYTQLNLQMLPVIAAYKVLLKRPLAFKRVLRVLLHNAFRHGVKWVQLEVSLSEKLETTVEELIITIENLSDEQRIRSLAQRFNPVLGELGSSPFIRGRLGLAVAYQLATEAGGVLGDLEWSPSRSDPDHVEVKISLTWPITLIDDTLEPVP